MRSFVWALLLCGCSYDWTYRPDAGTGTTKDAGGDPSDPNAEGGTTPTECARDKTSCPPGQYCHFFDRACGASKPIGECRDPDPSCKSEAQCACDGSTLGACDAQSKGLDVDESSAACKASGTFSCGVKTCTPKSQFCLTKQGGTPECQDTASCTDGCKCPYATSYTGVGCICDDSGSTSSPVISTPAATCSRSASSHGKRSPTAGSSAARPRSRR